MSEAPSPPQALKNAPQIQQAPEHPVTPTNEHAPAPQPKLEHHSSVLDKLRGFFGNKPPSQDVIAGHNPTTGNYEVSTYGDRLNDLSKSLTTEKPSTPASKPSQEPPAASKPGDNQELTELREMLDREHARLDKEASESTTTGTPAAIVTNLENARAAEASSGAPVEPPSSKPDSSGYSTAQKVGAVGMGLVAAVGGAHELGLVGNAPIAGATETQTTAPAAVSEFNKPITTLESPYTTTYAVSPRGAISIGQKDATQTEQTSDTKTPAPTETSNDTNTGQTETTGTAAVETSNTGAAFSSTNTDGDFTPQNNVEPQTAEGGVTSAVPSTGTTVNENGVGLIDATQESRGDAGPHVPEVQAPQLEATLKAASAEGKTVECAILSPSQFAENSKFTVHDADGNVVHSAGSLEELTGFLNAGNGVEWDYSAKAGCDTYAQKARLVIHGTHTGSNFDPSEAQPQLQVSGEPTQKEQDGKTIYEVQVKLPDGWTPPGGSNGVECGLQIDAISGIKDENGNVLPGTLDVVGGEGGKYYQFGQPEGSQVLVSAGRGRVVCEVVQAPPPQELPPPAPPIIESPPQVPLPPAEQTPTETPPPALAETGFPIKEATETGLGLGVAGGGLLGASRKMGGHETEDIKLDDQAGGDGNPPEPDHHEEPEEKPVGESIAEARKEARAEKDAAAENNEDPQLAELNKEIDELADELNRLQDNIANAKGRIARMKAKLAMRMAQGKETSLQAKMNYRESLMNTKDSGSEEESSPPTPPPPPSDNPDDYGKAA